MGTRGAALSILFLALAGCPPPATGPSGTTPTGTESEGAPEAGTEAAAGGETAALAHAAPAAPPPTITVARVDKPADVPTTPPAAGEWRLHMIDVGTGLSILIQGHDFTLLYDAGTNDKGEKPLRVLAYLATALGASGDSVCVARGAPAPGVRRAIDHVVLSHPHFDHASALDEIVHCYDVANLWDSGAVNQAVFYRELLEVVSHAKHLAYHTAAAPPANRTVVVKSIPIVIPATVDWTTFSEGDVVELGAGARFELLHAEGKKHADMNENSVVIALELGRTRVLLTGDAESGARALPSAPIGDIERHLIDHFAKEIDCDILQVGHHGSKTSSRAAFLAAVSPSYALVSAGPTKYKTVVLPDQEVIDALTATGATVLRTDARDKSCPAGKRLGGDTGPGGCDSYILTIKN